MAQTANLATITTVSYGSGGIAQITAAYNPGADVSTLPNTILAMIGAGPGQLLDKPYVEGDLLIIMTNYPNEIGYTIDSGGNLILFDNTNDILLYYIDFTTGELMYGIPPVALEGVGYWTIEGTFIVS